MRGINHLRPREGAALAQNNSPPWGQNLVKSIINKVRKKIRTITSGTKIEQSVHKAATRRQFAAERKEPVAEQLDIYRPRESHQKAKRKRRVKQSTTKNREDASIEKVPEERNQHCHEGNKQANASPSSDKSGSKSSRRRRRRGGQQKGRQGGKIMPQDRAPKPQAITREIDSWDVASYVVQPAEGKTRFHDLDLPNNVMHAIADLKFEYCTPIQAELLPPALKGKDVFGKAQTGTGKSAAFLLTILTHLHRKPGQANRKNGTPRVLILAPTRELVMQLKKDVEELASYTSTNVLAIFGGMEYEKQKRHLMGQVVDIMIATPGRLLDFKRKRDLHLSKVEILIIDEADRMFDMGFIPDVRNIIHSTPPRHQRQTLLLSATLTKEVTRLASQWTKDPHTIEIEPKQVAVDTVNQVIYIVTADEKFPLLYNMIKHNELTRVMVFVNRRDEVRRLTDDLQRHDIACDMLSGEVNQRKRMKTLEDFREGKIPVLIATDVAGRGIHIEGVSHVVNYTLPADPEDYVHRIGRTGRAGASGTSISFASETDSFHIPDIEAYIGRDLPCTYPDDALLAALPAPTRPRAKEQSRRPASTRGSGRTRKTGQRSGGGRGNFTSLIEEPQDQVRTTK